MSVVSCVEVPAPVGELLDRYREYLIVERGLRPTTVATYSLVERSAVRVGGVRR